MISTEHIRAEILRLIEQHEPNKADLINELMNRWKTKESELLYSLCIKYEAKYTKMSTKTMKDLYQIGPKIGCGGFATVRKCKRKSDGQYFAVKIIKKSNYNNDEELKLLE